MRFLLVVILFALLPMRGWAGDVMALQMVATDVSHRQAHCPEASKLLQLDNQPAKAQQQDHCSACAVCQVFQAAALAAETQMPSLSSNARHLPMVLDVVFSSVAAAPVLKPPIF